MPGSRGLGCHQHPTSRGPRAAQPGTSAEAWSHACELHHRDTTVSARDRGQSNTALTRAPSAPRHEAVGSPVSHAAARQGTGVGASKAQTNSQHPAWWGRALKRRACTAGSKHTPPPWPQGWGPEARAPAQQPMTRPPLRGA